MTSRADGSCGGRRPRAGAGIETHPTITSAASAFDERL